MQSLAQLCADAIRWFDRAIDLDDTDSAFFLNRADCHQTLGNTAEALSDLEQAHNLSAHDPQARRPAGEKEFCGPPADMD